MRWKRCGLILVVVGCVDFLGAGEARGTGLGRYLNEGELHAIYTPCGDPKARSAEGFDRPIHEIS